MGTILPRLFTAAFCMSLGFIAFRNGDAGWALMLGFFAGANLDSAVHDISSRYMK